jgi:N-acetyl-anhydromuramyl-L-alanine amidase AmpD
LVGELNPFSFGKNNLNSWAITIQHINNSREHFSEAQIKATAYLMDQLVDACNIDPKYVLAHAYYAPERMISPGPYFPWAKLAKASEHYGTTHNFGVFSFKERQENPEIIVSSKKHEPAEVSMVQDELEQLGIKVLKEDKSNLGLWDEQTQRGILAFNLQNKGEEIIKNPDTLEAYNRLTQNSKDQEALDSLTVWDQNNEIIIKDSIEQYMLVGDVVADYDSAA